MSQGKIALWVMGAMLVIAGGIIGAVLVVDTQMTGAGAGQEPPGKNTKASHADTGPLEAPSPPQQSVTTDSRSSDEEATDAEPADEPRAQPKAPDWSQVCAEVARAGKSLRAADWRFDRQFRLDEHWLPLEYSLEYSRSVGGARLLAQLTGDDSRLIGFGLNGYVGSISSAAEHSQAKRKAWALFVTTAKALIPDVGSAIAESRAAAEDQGMWNKGQSWTLSGWRVITRDYEDQYMLRPRSEGDWLLTLHISRN